MAEVKSSELKGEDLLHRLFQAGILIKLFNGIWETVKPKLVIGENVNQTLQYARTKNVDVAIVALSLAMGSGNTRWVLIPDNLHQPINQALGVVKSTAHEKEARQFTAFVNSRQGRETMRKYGFTLPGEQLPK